MLLTDICESAILILPNQYVSMRMSGEKRGCHQDSRAFMCICAVKSANQNLRMKVVLKQLGTEGVSH